MTTMRKAEPFVGWCQSSARAPVEPTLNSVESIELRQNHRIV